MKMMHMVKRASSARSGERAGETGSARKRRKSASYSSVRPQCPDLGVRLSLEPRDEAFIKRVDVGNGSQNGAEGSVGATVGCTGCVLYAVCAMVRRLHTARL